MTYKLKQIPEDFIVNEVIKIETSNTGRYSYFIMRKTDYATPAAVEKIAKFLNIDVSRIRFAGTKDRKAITTQWISIENCQGRINDFKDSNITLEFRGKSDKPIYLGMLEGNEFGITIRNINKIPKKIGKFLNLFDEQRFSMNNVEIGREIIKKNFRKAVEILIQSNGYYERELKVEFEKTNDPIRALRKVPFHVINFFVHAYQSDLWNRTAELLSDYAKNKEIPIIGFGTDIQDKKIQKAVDKVMQEEKITYRDFIIRSMPELSSEGNSRMLFAEVKKFKTGKLEDDELNPGMKKIKVSFFLNKGCYATMAIKYMFKKSSSSYH